ncbi:hypothetical protein [Streptomyces sp. NPDC087300]|uniref:hypothetical protein n=1 Tax=Streptomyces sp. NPDC087300 TaxID=3365780 RepID=UPI0038242774
MTRRRRAALAEVAALVLAVGGLSWGLGWFRDADQLGERWGGALDIREAQAYYGTGGRTDRA